VYVFITKHIMSKASVTSVSSDHNIFAHVSEL
jgi:hypothetical protein